MSPQVDVAERLGGMVGDDRDDVHRQLADALAIEQVGQAVVELGDQDQHLARRVSRARSVQSHGVALGERRRSRRASAAASPAPGSNTTRMKKRAVSSSSNCCASRMLPPRSNRKPVTARDDARAVGAGQGQDLRAGHRRALTRLAGDVEVGKVHWRGHAEHLRADRAGGGERKRTEH